MMWGIIVDVMTIILILFIIWFAFAIKQRLSKELSAGMVWTILATIIFGVSRIIKVVEDLEIASTVDLRRVLHVLAMGLLVIGFWSILKHIRKVDGELKDNKKFKVK